MRTARPLIIQETFYTSMCGAGNPQVMGKSLTWVMWFIIRNLKVGVMEFSMKVLTLTHYLCEGSSTSNRTSLQNPTLHGGGHHQNKKEKRALAMTQKAPIERPLRWELQKSPSFFYKATNLTFLQREGGSGIASRETIQTSTLQTTSADSRCECTISARYVLHRPSNTIRRTGSASSARR